MKNIKVSLVAFCDANQQVMLNRRCLDPLDHQDLWEMVGGGVESEEFALATIKREIGEELHYQLDEFHDHLVFVRRLRVVTDKFSALVYFFKADFPGVDKFSNSDEIDVANLRLFSLNDAMSLKLLPICRKIILFLKSEITQ